MKHILTFILFAFILLAQPAQATLIWYSNMDGTADPLVPNVGAATCAFVNSPTGGATGKFGTAFDFDAGTTDYLNCGSTPILTTDNWTISAWIKLETSASWRVILQDGDYSGGGANGKSGVLLGIDNIDHARCLGIVGAESEFDLSSSGTIDETGAVWTHLVCQKNGTAVALYVNGSSADTDTASSSTMDYTGNAPKFYWGVQNNVTSPFLGQIDEGRFYNSVEDPAALYAINPSRRSQVIIFQ